MGYTHYIDGEIDSCKWAAYCAVVRKIIADPSVAPLLCREYDLPETSPEVSRALIAFNGKRVDGHETFYLESKSRGFWFCKTARKPYDVAVTACLLALRALMPEVRISSDGRPRDWEAGCALLWAVAPELGVGLDNVVYWLGSE